MEYKDLGRTGLQISRLGFGCWLMGGSRWGKVNDADSIRAVERSLDLGINFFDTADVYGFGHSEKVLSKALGNRKKDVIIATKFGVRWDNQGRTMIDCSPKHIKEALEGSLRRLKIDCIPLYQIHWPDPYTPLSDTIAELIKYQSSGEILHIGCSNFNFDLLNTVQKLTRIESDQVPYNLVERRIEVDLIPFCIENDISIVVYQPLLHGLLSGKYNEKSVFSEDDFRSADINFQGERYQKNLSIVKVLSKLANKNRKDRANIAIRWLLDNTKITCVVTGIRNQTQVQANVESLHWKLSPEDYDMLSSLSI